MELQVMLGAPVVLEGGEGDSGGEGGEVRHGGWVKGGEGGEGL